MERLLKDAKKISGIKYDISSYSDIVDAIHVVQKEMGIAGTTAKEASTTIEGSLKSVKSSWSDLITSLSDPNADIGSKINNFVSSIETAADNLIPTIEIALSGAGTLISKLLPKIVNEIPNLIKDVIPDMFDKVDELVTTTLDSIGQNKDTIIKGLIDLLVKLVDIIANNAPKFVTVVMDLVTTLFNTLADKADEIVPKIFNSIVKVVEEFIKKLPNVLGSVLKLIVSLVNSIVDYLPTLVEKLPNVLDGIVKFILASIPLIIKAITSITANIIDELPDLLVAIFKALPEMITTLVESVPELLSGLLELALLSLVLPFELLGALGKSIVELIFGEEAADEMEESVKKWFDIWWEEAWKNFDEKKSEIGTFIGKVFDEAWARASGFFPWLWEQIKNVFNLWWQSLPEDAQKNLTEVWEKISKLFSGGSEFSMKLWNTVSNFLSESRDKLTKWFDDNWNIAFKLGQGIFNNIVKGLSDAFAPSWAVIGSTFDDLWVKISKWWDASWEKVTSIGSNIIKGIKEGITTSWDAFWKWLSGQLNKSMDNILEFFGIHSPSTLMRDKVGKNLVAGLAEGIKDNFNIVDKVVDNVNGKLLNLGDVELQDLNGSISYSTNGMMNGVSANKPNLNLNVTFGDVTMNSDEDIEEVANKVSEAIAEKVLQMGMAVG